VSEVAHSPSPFRLLTRPASPTLGDVGGYLVVDAMGDSIGALAARTGDHPPEEQLANAHLFKAAPLLLEAARIGRAAVAIDLALTIEAHTVPDPETLKPDLTTMEAIAVPFMTDLVRLLEQIDTAIASAEGRF
jgi:hypothetical protein